MKVKVVNMMGRLKKLKAQIDANQAREEKMIEGRNSKAEKSSVKFLSPYSGLGT